MSNIVPYAEMQHMAAAMAKSKLFGMKTADEVIALMLVAQANGQHPAAAARDYDIIQGRPSKKAEAMLRDFIGAGGSVQWHQLDNQCAAATFSHPHGGSIRIDWDMQRAREAGLAGKDMYKKWPRQMLRSRCISEGVRTIYPVATGGLYAPEEVQDLPPHPTVKDMGDVERAEADPALIEAGKEAAAKGLEAYAKWWTEIGKDNRKALVDLHEGWKADAAQADEQRTIEG